MSFSLIPKMLCPTLTDLTVERLHRAGVTFLMLDFDNTIVPYTNDVPTPEMEAWLQAMQASDIGLCVVSNSHKTRVVKFCEARGNSLYRRTRKSPFPREFSSAGIYFPWISPTPPWWATRSIPMSWGPTAPGRWSILVRPIHLHNIWLRLRHVAELPFIFIGKRSATL